VITEGGIIMNKKKSILKNTIIFGIVILFLGIAVQPGTADMQIKTTFKEQKDILFQTITEILNNKEVEDFCEKELKNGLYIDFDNNFRNTCRKILFRNPFLFHSLLFTKPSATEEYLNFAFENSNELIDIVGDDKAIDLVESMTISSPTFSKELINVIEKNDELSSKLEKIKEMNQEFNQNLPIERPLLCAIALMLTFTYAIPMVTLSVMVLVLSSRPLLGPIFLGILGLFTANLALFLTLINKFC
jgi:hypothetical protein